MPYPPVAGLFTEGVFTPHTSQEDVDSGLPDWTLGEDGLPPAEPTGDDVADDDFEDFEDNEGEEIEDEDSGEQDSEVEYSDDGYDADADGEDEYDSDDDDENGGCALVDEVDDDDEYADDYEYFLSTLPVGTDPVLDDTVSEGTSDDNFHAEEYEHFLSTLPAANSPILDETVPEGEDSYCSCSSCYANSPPLSDDSGVWTLVSDSADTEEDEPMRENVAIRSTSPDDLHETLGGHALMAWVEDVRRLIERRGTRGRVGRSRRFLGYESDENDQPDEPRDSRHRDSGVEAATLSPAPPRQNHAGVDDTIAHFKLIREKADFEQGALTGITTLAAAEVDDPTTCLGIPAIRESEFEARRSH
ncbi:hypothetical protein Q7P36_001870 [Cladosporium allicinum]